MKSNRNFLYNSYTNSALNLDKKSTIKSKIKAYNTKPVNTPKVQTVLPKTLVNKKKPFSDRNSTFLE